MTDPAATFVAGLSIPQFNDDAATLLQQARSDGYDFITTALPSYHHNDNNYYNHVKSTLTNADADVDMLSSQPHPTVPAINATRTKGLHHIIRRDITSLDAKWWSTSIVGMVVDPPSFTNDNEISGSFGVEDLNMGVTNTVNTPNFNRNSPNYGQNLIASLCQTSSTAEKVALAEEATKTITSMMDWASHMNIPAVVLPPIPPNPFEAIQYARLLATLALKASVSNVQLWIRVPCTQEGLHSFLLLQRRCGGVGSVIGCMLLFDSSSDLITPPPPPTTNATNSAAAAAAAATNTSNLLRVNVGKNMALLHQFVGSNLRAVSFDTSIFLTNKRGYPTLSKSHQILFAELLKRLGRTMRVLVEGVPLHHSPAVPSANTTGVAKAESGGSGSSEASGLTGCLSYIQYLRHLRSREEISSVLDNEESRMETGYLDHLQSPLQPLGDNLEYQTYETFEKDPVKYKNYGYAVELALNDGIALGKFHEPSSNEIQVIILVVGGGRGPLVTASLKAVANVNDYIFSQNKKSTNPVKRIQPKVIVIEKNPSAILYLQSIKSRQSSWHNVEVIQCDMRYASSHPLLRPIINGPQSSKADIVVSELLGSFGDNELSPECLDGVQRSNLLKRSCVSIPQSYTSYLAPVSSMRLHAEAQSQYYLPSDPMEGPGGKACGMLQALETPYVVRTHAASQTHPEVACWKFTHFKQEKGMMLTDPAGKDKFDGDGGGNCTPAAAATVDNQRYVQIKFPSDMIRGTGHGSGYGRVDMSSFKMAVDAANHVASTTNPTGVDDSTKVSPMSTTTTTIPSTMLLHGFLGTFECILYQSVLPPSRKGSKYDTERSSIISIAPKSFSVGMFSWFPLYFPLRDPLCVPGGASICCNMWRKTDADGDSGSGRVWYEWCADVVLDDGSGLPSKIIDTSALHNPNGRSSHVRL